RVVCVSWCHRHHRPIGGVAQSKHIDGGKMCDGWPAGPAPVLLSHCLTASAIHRLSSMSSLTFREVWAYFSVDRDGFVHLRHSAGSGRRPISRWARLDPNLENTVSSPRHPCVTPRGRGSSFRARAPKPVDDPAEGAHCNVKYNSNTEGDQRPRPVVLWLLL